MAPKCEHRCADKIVIEGEFWAQKTCEGRRLDRRLDLGRVERKW